MNGDAVTYNQPTAVSLGGYQRGRGLTNPQPTYRNTSTLAIDHPPLLLPDMVTIDINLSGFKLPVSPLATQLDSSCAL